MRRQPLNLAHRGASAHAPENTLAAFELARTLGADGIEFDVQLSRDGELVIIHDEQLERTTDGRGLVHEHSLAELKQLVAGRHLDAKFAGERIPTLQEVFDLLGTTLLLNVELKHTSAPVRDRVERVVACVERNHMRERVLISSFDWKLLERVRALDPRLQIGVLYRQPVNRGDYELLRPDAIHPHANLVTPELVASAHARGQAVNTWTVDAEDLMRQLIAWSVDAIMTNHPERLKAILDQTVTSTVTSSARAPRS